MLFQFFLVVLPFFCDGSPVCLVSVCDVYKNVNTMCRGPCNRTFVQKTDNEEDCINICKSREKCKHYIWHYTNAPTTVQKSECWVVDVEEGEYDSAYRERSINAVTGTCHPGSTYIRIQYSYRVSHYWRGVGPQKLARASALQSDAIQVFDWQQR